jgi:hypothetical protein
MAGKLTTIAVIAGLITSNAEAALLTNIQGFVTLNHGDGFQPAMPQAVILPGDRVRTGQGSADLVYDNGCVVKIGPGQMVAVLNTAPVCSDGGSKDGGTGISTGTLLVGGLLVGGGIAAGVIYLMPKHPASP